MPVAPSGGAAGADELATERSGMAFEFMGVGAAGLFLDGALGHADGEVKGGADAARCRWGVKRRAVPMGIAVSAVTKRSVTDFGSPPARG